MRGSPTEQRRAITIEVSLPLVLMPVVSAIWLRSRRNSTGGIPKVVLPHIACGHDPVLISLTALLTVCLNRSMRPNLIKAFLLLDFATVTLLAAPADASTPRSR